MVGDHRFLRQKDWAMHKSCPRPFSYTRPELAFKPQPDQWQNEGSVSPALWCQMQYDITLAGWCKGVWLRWGFKAFGSCHQLNHSYQHSDLCHEVTRRNEMWGFIRLVESPVIDSFLWILYGKVMICEVWLWIRHDSAVVWDRSMIKEDKESTVMVALSAEC